MHRLNGKITVILCLMALGACGGGGGAAPPPPAVSLKSIAVTPATPSLSVGGQQQLSALGTYSDQSTKDLTMLATWTSSTSSVATVTGGLVTGVTSGSTTIAATYDAVAGNDVVTVPPSAWVPAAAAPIIVSATTATRLSDGTILVDGGDPYQSPPGAAVYDPVANAWSRTGATATARSYATATLLKDGRVLVAGGSVLNIAAPSATNPTSIDLASTELYDPSTKTWSAGANLPGPRELQAAVLLPDGKVLVVGGDDGHAALADALVYDPTANIWTSIPTPITVGILPTATILQSGKVIVSANLSPGAYSLIYDPTTSMWSNGPNMNNLHLLGATATLLPDGRVLVAGGRTGITPSAPLSVPELYDPATNAWTPAATMVTNRAQHTATLLLSGKVLVAGGGDQNMLPLASAELYDPAANTWSAAASMTMPRTGHGAVLLKLGQVFVTGGSNQGVVTLTSELYR